MDHVALSDTLLYLSNDSLNASAPFNVLCMYDLYIYTVQQKNITIVLNG